MPDNVATPSASYDRQELRRKLCRDLTRGTGGMREATTEYLLKFDAEDSADYTVRLKDSFLVPYFENAVDNVVGKVFGKPLVLSETTPSAIWDEAQNTGIWNNVDLQGASADLFLYGVGRDAVVNGLSFVLVDVEQAPKDEAGNIILQTSDKKTRPYWKHFKAQDVIEAMVTYEDGLPRLQRLRVLAKSEVPDGEWGTKCVDRVLVFDRGTKASPAKDGQPASMQTFARYRVYEKHDDGKGGEKWDELPGMAGTFQPSILTTSVAVRSKFVEIPCVAFYTEKTAPYEADPPLRDSLGDMCLQHWRKKSRLDTILDAVNTPIMVYSGLRADFEGAQGAAAVPTTGYTSGGVTTDTTRTVNQRQLSIGPFTILFAGGEGRAIEWLEHTGTSITAGFADLERLEKQIQQAALDPFTRQSQGTETATAEILAEGRTMTRAQVWATSWESSINSLLSWTAAWLGLDDGGSATFGKGVMESLGGGDFGQVVTLFEKGEIDGESLISEAKRYGVIGPDVVRAADADQRAEERKEARQALAGLRGSPQVPGPGDRQKEDREDEDAA